MFNFDAVNWLSVGAAFVAGQVFLTLYFTVLLGEPWARAYGEGKTRKEHTKEVPPYTYGIGAACTLVVAISLGVLYATLGISSVGDAVKLGSLIAFGLVTVAIVPGYAFLRRLDAAIIAAGSQAALVLIVSAILGAWN